MKAMVLKTAGELSLDTFERPVPRSQEVLVRVTNSGICGTDLKIFTGAIAVRHPLIMGHEMTGEIVAAPGDEALTPGQRVIVDPSIYCGQCFQCRAGQTNLCPNGVLLGRDANGGFAEFISVPRGHVFALPDAIDPRTAPIIQVMATCLHAQRLVNIFPGESVVVSGLGVTGQIHVQLAKARGAHPVIGITRSAWKRELAEELGADVTLAAGEATGQRVRQETGQRGADLVIDTSGAMSALAEAVALARIGGRLLLFGITTAKEGALPFYDIYYKELAIYNARASKPEDYPATIDLVHRGIVRLRPLVTNVMPLTELREAIGMLKSDAERTMKVILEH